MSEQEYEEGIESDDGAATDQETADQPPEAENGEHTPREAAAESGSAEIPRKLERALKTHKTRIEGILGMRLDGHECATCDGMGFVMEPQGAAPDLRDADDAEPCEGCNAFGFVRTGSKVPGQDSKPCGRCGGRGWHEKVLPPPPFIPVQAASPEQPAQFGGNFVPGVGFIPYGATEPLPGTAGA